MKLFLYGTLKHSEENAMAQILKDKLSAPRAATVPGCLFVIPHERGYYPALTPAETAGDRTGGFVYETLNTFAETDLQQIDAYEEYYPSDIENSEYLRRVVTVEYDDGTTDQAEAYLYNAALPEGAIRVPDGDFSSFMRSRNLTSFSS